MCRRMSLPTRHPVRTLLIAVGAPQPAGRAAAPTGVAETADAIGPVA